jgi:Ras-related protein Rab-1A
MSSTRIPTVKHDVLLKVIIFGGEGVGKSALIERYSKNIFSDAYQPTVGTECFQQYIDLNNKTIKLQIWDLSGQQKYKVITESYYSQGSAKLAPVFLAVYDLTQANTLQKLETFIQVARKQSPNSDFILVGTKSDFIKQRVISDDDIHAFKQKMGIKIDTMVSNKLPSSSSKNHAAIFGTCAEIAWRSIAAAPVKNPESVVAVVNDEPVNMNKPLNLTIDDLIQFARRELSRLRFRFNTAAKVLAIQEAIQWMQENENIQNRSAQDIAAESGLLQALRIHRFKFSYKAKKNMPTDAIIRLDRFAPGFIK